MARSYLRRLVHRLSAFRKAPHPTFGPLPPVVLFADPTGNLALWPDEVGATVVGGRLALATPSYAYSAAIAGVPPASGVTSVRATVANGADSTANFLELRTADADVLAAVASSGAGNAWASVVARDGSSVAYDAAPFGGIPDRDAATEVVLELLYDTRGVRPVARAYLGGVLVATATDLSAGAPLPAWVPSFVGLSGGAEDGTRYYRAVTVASGFQGV